MLSFALLLALQSTPDAVELPADTVEMPADETPDASLEDGKTTDEAIANAEANVVGAALEAADAAEQDWRSYTDRQVLNVDGWLVNENEHDCSLWAPTPLFFTYDGKLDKLWFHFIEKSISSLRTGDKRRINFAFKNPEWQLFNQPFEFTAQTFDDSKIGTSLATVLPSYMLDILAKSDAVGFQTEKGVIINAYTLNGSAKAIAALRECAARVARERPSDPFTK